MLLVDIMFAFCSPLQEQGMLSCRCSHSNQSGAQMEDRWITHGGKQALRDQGRPHPVTRHQLRQENPRIFSRLSCNLTEPFGI